MWSPQAVVPAHAGTHTPCRLVGARWEKPFVTTKAGGYRSLLSQGRQAERCVSVIPDGVSCSLLFGAFFSPPPPRSSGGEGWGEGLFPRIRTRGESPSPEAFGFDLSPQAGRGKKEAPEHEP